jgi:hypothetical protein
MVNGNTNTQRKKIWGDGRKAKNWAGQFTRNYLKIEIKSKSHSPLEP